MITYVMGMDPGKSGALAVLRLDGTVSKIEQFSKLTERDLWESLKGWRVDDIRCYFEHTHSFGASDNAATSYVFGDKAGLARGFLIARGLPFEMVPPKKWQRGVGIQVIKGARLSYPDRKRRNKQKAQELFPHVKITNDVADALLIAEYGRRQLCNHSKIT